MEGMTIEEFARRNARRGWSMAMVAEALELELRQVQEHLAGKGIKWPKQGHSLKCRALQESKVGIYADHLRRGNEASSKASKARAARYVVRGVEGSAVDLWERFGGESPITFSTFKRRLTAGKNPDEAMFAASQVNKGLEAGRALWRKLHHGENWEPLRRQRASADAGRGSQGGSGGRVATTNAGRAGG